MFVKLNNVIWQTVNNIMIRIYRNVNAWNGINKKIKTSNWYIFSKIYIRANLLRSRWIPSYRIDIYFAATYRTQETAADCETLVTLLYFFYLPFYTNQSPFTLCSSSMLRFIEFVVKTYLVQMRRQYPKFVDIFLPCLYYTSICSV